MRKPNFFLIGAPKCGTTSLARWLSTHDDIFMSTVKEPNYFNRDHVDVNRPTDDEYQRFFQGAGDQRVIGEASPWYIYSSEAIPNILRYNREAVFVVCVRNTVSMAFSLHNQAVFAGIESLLDFRDAWAAQSERQLGRNVPKNVEPAHLLYGPICRVGEQIQRVHNWAGASRTHIVFLEDFRRDPAGSYRSVLRFLGVPDSRLPSFEVANRSQARRSWAVREMTRQLGFVKRSLGVRTNLGLLTALDRWNRKPQPYPVDPALAEEVEAYLEPDIKLIEQLTGRDLSHWRRGGSECPTAIQGTSARPTS